MSLERCEDDRFEVIAKAKEALLNGTNIETSPDEMKVIDSFLFRCWQMGWLNKYDNVSEKDLARYSLDTVLEYIAKKLDDMPKYYDNSDDEYFNGKSFAYHNAAMYVRRISTKVLEQMQEEKQ